MNTRTVPNMAPLMEADGFILAFGTRMMIKKKTRKRFHFDRTHSHCRRKVQGKTEYQDKKELEIDYNPCLGLKKK